MTTILACGCDVAEDGFRYVCCDEHEDLNPCLPHWPLEVQDAVRARARAARERKEAMRISLAAPRQRWKVRPSTGGQWLYIERLEDIGPADDGLEFELVSVWLTDSELEALGEFNGW